MLVKKAPFLAGVGGGGGEHAEGGFVHNTEGIRVGVVLGGCVSQNGLGYAV